MIEAALLPVLAIAFAAAIPKGNRNDRATIEKVFKNVGFGLLDVDTKKLMFPKYKRKEVIYDGIPKNKEEEKQYRIGTTYFYTTPPGLKVYLAKEEEKKWRYWSSALNKPVEIEYKKILMIHVYDDELKTKIPYADIPVPTEEQVKDWAVPIGKAISGFIWHSFDKVPHMTAAGTTRFGKTVLLRMIMTYLITHHPNDIELYIIDLKGGLEFKRYKCLRQVKMLATNPQEALALLTYLTNENLEMGPLGVLEQDFSLFERKLWHNIVDTPLKKRRFIIVDEGAQLTPAGKGFESKEDGIAKALCQAKLSRIAGVFGAVGARVIFGTQYPTSDTLPRNVKMNADAKISFRVPAGYASEVAIDDYGAEKLPSTVPGRALFKTHELREMQVPFITHEEMWELLAKYQDPILLEGVAENVFEYPKETKPARTDPQQSGCDAVRDEGTTPEDPPFRL